MNKKRIIFCIVIMFLLLNTQALAQTILRVSTWGGAYQQCYEADINEFEKENNVRVEWVLGDDMSVNVRARLGELDVVTTDLVNSLMGEREGLWAVLDETKIPNMANLVDIAKYSKYTIFSNASDIGLAYNSKYVDPTPTSWDVMWDPAYKNRVAIMSFIGSSTTSLIVLLAEQRGGGVDNIDPGLNKLVELYKSGNLIGMVASNAEMQSLLEMEETWIGVFTAGRVLGLQKSGFDFIKFARPKEGTFGMISTLNVPKATEKLDLAMKFVNHVLSPKVQETFAERLMYSPTVNNAYIPPELEGVLLSVKDINRLFIPDWIAVNKVKEEWAERWDRLIH